MFTKTLIALVAFLVVAGTASAMEWQPSWAAEPLPLVHGQEYRSGSPLSRPGLLGLLGGLANAVTGGELSAWTGGGFEVWQGATEAAPATITINGVQMRVFTHAEALAAQEAAGATIENRPRLGDDKRADCGYSFAKAVAQDSAYDWCNDQPVDHAALPDCPTGERMFVTIVRDDELGARNVYTCQEAAQ